MFYTGAFLNKCCREILNDVIKLNMKTRPSGVKTAFGKMHF